MKKTIEWHGSKLTIETSRRTHMKNPNGFRVRVNGQAYNVFMLEQNKAETYAIEKYLDEHSCSACYRLRPNCVCT